MKKIFLYGVSVLMSASLAVSCLGDLDTMPIDQTVFTADKAFAEPESYSQYVNYAYSYFSLVSQGDPGSSDIAVSDAGQSEFTRQYMILNEMPTDALKCVWNDSYVPEIGYDRWNASNTAVLAVYLRGLKGVAICNQFLDESVSGDGAVSGRGHESVLNEVHAYRAELRLLRAVYYSILLDMFGNPPLVLPEHIGSSDFPRQMSTDFNEGRRLLFAWVESELKACIADDYLPAQRVMYPRLSKGAAWAVLARLYLNAEVYTGTARWQDAKDAAYEVIEHGGYQLCSNYEHLFLQDNSTNGAQNEFIIAAMYDCETTQSWGGTTHLVYSPAHDDYRVKISQALGYSTDIYKNVWNGYHCSEAFIDENFALTDVEEGVFKYNGDKRARLCYFDNPFTNEVTDITSGYTCLKWLPITSTGEPLLVNKDIEQSSADFPFYRLAEMYLIYAEAEARINGGTLPSGGQGAQYLQKLGERANGSGYTLPATVDTDWILKERVRELMWEGHRRVDLIRYGRFTSSQYPWPYKAGVADGRAAIDSYRTVYPIISTDLIANPNLVQNPGY